jgi:hypothetical protein
MATFIEIVTQSDRDAMPCNVANEEVQSAAEHAVSEYLSRFAMPIKSNRAHIYHAIKTAVKRRDEILGLRWSGSKMVRFDA